MEKQKETNTSKEKIVRNPDGTIKGIITVGDLVKYEKTNKISK